jgi:hypothetical protein
MESAPRKHMDWNTYATGLPMIVWGASFFFPTLIANQNNWFFPGATPGFMAPVASFVMLVLVIATNLRNEGMKPPTPEDVFLYFSLSSLWMANFWMLLAPAMSKRLREGKGQIFLFTAWIWTLVPIPIALKARGNHSDIGGIKIATGFYVWWASFLFLALVCTAHFLRSRPNQLEPYPPPRT